MTETIAGWTFKDLGPLGITHGTFNPKTLLDPQFCVDAAAVGASVVRLQLSAILIETANGVYDWTFLDDAVQKACQAGLRVTFPIREFAPKGGGTSWATYSTPCESGGTYYYGTYQNWTNFAVALCQRYSGDGNPKNAIATDGSKRPLVIMQIEIGNEDFDVHNSATGGCRDPMRYVQYLRAIVPQMRLPVSQGGGGWTRPIGMWGCWWQNQAHIQNVMNTLYRPVASAQFNPTNDFSSTASLWDYANFHNYQDPAQNVSVQQYGIDQELKDVRAIMNANGDTAKGIWVTEFGADGPVGSSSEAAQSTYYAANADGTGVGALNTLMTNGAQHADLFTMSYDAAGSNGYVGDPKSIACAVASGGYKRFQAFTTVQNFLKANPTWPFGFGTPPPAQGSITAPTPTTLASAINLTTDGSTGATMDWAHWGLSSVTAFDHKSGVTQQIQNYTAVGSGTITQDTATGVGFTWTDGTPDSTATTTTTGIKVSGLSNGFSFTVPISDTNAHYLNVYVGASLAQGQLRVSFNDGTTPDYVDTSVNATGGTISAMYALTYTALASGTLTVTWTMKTSNAAGSYISLQSADIPGGTPPTTTGSVSSLSGSVNLTPSASVTLTTDGGSSTSDWSHWGYTGTQQDHKTGVTSLISNFTAINNGNGVVQQNTATPIAYAWSDGTPDGSVSGTSTSVQIVLPGQGSSSGGGGGTGGSITLSPSTLSFSTVTATSSPAAQTLVLSNGTSTAATWTSSIAYGSGTGWLTVSPSSGSVAATSTQSLSISCTLGSLAVGTYTATVTFTFNGTTTLTCAVTFSVNAASGGGTPGPLPGQVIYPNGVSNYLFGTNNPNYTGSTITTNTATQTMIKNAGFTVMRLAISPGSSNATVDSLVASATNSGCVPLIILIHNNASWNSSLVTYLGSRCLLYEFANEPDLYGGYTGANYYTDWAANIPTLRGINPSAAFIGPVMGVYDNLQGWLQTWLTSCATSGTAGMMPDGISYHIYPCTGDASQSDCATKPANIGNTAPQVNSWISSILAGTSYAGKVLPLCMTEWNIDANGPPQAYTQNAAFCNTWYPAALESMANNGFALACQFDASSGAGSSVSGVNGALDMLDTGGGSPHVSWQPIISEIAKLQPTGGGGTGGSGGGTGGNPTSPHIAVVMMENRSYSEIMGNTTGWPHLNALLTTYGYCSSFYGTTHPSLPNYLAMTCGSTKGVTNDTYDPSASPIAGTSLFDSLDGASIGWKVYAESLPSAGYLGTDSGNYFRKHNPVVYYANFRNASTTYQTAHLVAYEDASVGLQADLNSSNAPAFLFIAPNEIDDGHGNPYQYPPTNSMDQAADTFVNGLVTMLQASTWYTQNHGKILFVWDEGIDTDTTGVGDANPGGGHSMVVCISEASKGQNFTTSINHYGVLRTIEEAYGLTLLNKSSNAANGDMSSLTGAYNAIGANAAAALVGGGGVSSTSYIPRALNSTLIETVTPLRSAALVGNSTQASNVGNGFSFTVLADTTPRTLKVYVDVNQGTGSFTASLLDGSGTPDYNDSSLTNLTGVSAACYTLQYQANAANQLLKVTYTLQGGSGGTGGVIASDTFSRDNNNISLGTATDGETWAVYTQSGTYQWGTVNQAALFTGTVSGGASAVALLGTQSVTDAEALATVTVSNQPDAAGLLLRASASGAAYYQALLVNGSFLLNLHTGGATGTDSTLKTVTASYKINTPYNIRFRIVGTTLSARFWPNDGTAEPTAWTVTGTDSTLASGQIGLRCRAAGNADTVTIDTYSVTSLVSGGSNTSASGAFVSLHAASMPGTAIVSVSGALSASSSTPTGTINLTSEGVNDWAAWGFTGASSFDHKTNVTSQLSTYTPIGSGTVTQGTSGLLGFTWTDGTPDLSATASTTESDVTGVANGYSFSVPADTNTRTLYVYCGVNTAQGTLTATLSDGSASAYSDSSLNSVSGQAVIRYAITYNAASANQTLTVTWTMLTDNGGTGTPTTLDTDTFTRANQTGWGTASGGHVWTQTAGGAALSIVSNKGQVTGTNGQAALMTLGTGTQTNGEALVEVTMSSPSTDSAALVLRLTASNTYYRCQLDSNKLYLSRVNAGTTTDMTSTSFPTTANTPYKIRFRLNGSTLYGRVWLSSGAEPTTWTLTVTDTANSITGAGQYGTRTHLGTSSATILYDNYTLTTIPGSSGTPGSLSLGAATLVGATGSSGSGGGGTPPPPTPTTSIPISVDTTQPLTTFWLGYGIGQDAYDHGTGVPIGITTTQRSLINERIANLNPQGIRTLAGNVNWWCPTGTVGTYNFTTSIMQEWYAVFDNAQANNIPVIVGLLAPTPFTATSSSWCTAFSDLLNYLINTLGYTCITYVSGLSEPDTQGVSYSQYKSTVEPQLVSALAANNLTNTVTLLGPETTSANDSWLTSASIDLHTTLGGYARHGFPTGSTAISNDSQETTLAALVLGIDANDPNGHPTLLTEMASGALAPGNNVTLYQYGVEMADYAVQAARAGIAAPMAWILDDDMHNTEYGLWGIVNSPTIRPWYFPWSLLCNTVPANCTLYTPVQPATNDFRVLAAQLPGGIGWTFVLVNRTNNTAAVTITVPNAPTASATFQQYVYSSTQTLLVDSNGFPLPSGTVTSILNRGMTVTMAANSVLILTQESSIVTSSYDVVQPPLSKRRQA